ncbi:hypothetical protein BGZ52_003328 [Haplosporangium bisporale]|nr:hypothetical protein BGZ52_003328 [Haplosporangium bisporale]
MNHYENTGYSQPQPRQNAQHNQQHYQQQQQQQQQNHQGGYHNPSQKYTPNAYQPQPAQAQRHHMTSPPPLQHPVPTHPPIQMREPAPTPSPRMNYAQAQGGQGQGHSQGQGQYNPNKYRPQQQQQHSQQRGSFEHSSFDQSYGSPQQQYMSPQAPPHQPHQQHHQHQGGHGQGQSQGQSQAQHGMPSFPFNLNDGTTQLGMQFGKSAVMAGQEYVEQNLNRWVNREGLQPYFNVSNSYVVNKLKLLVFPWRHKSWRSSPMFSWWLCQQVRTTGKFSPEILGPTASSALAVILLEFSMIKLCTYILNITSEVSMLDLLAYSGYKFVGIIVSIMAQLSKAPKSVFWTVFLYTGAATGFFLLRSLRYVILPEASAGTVQAPQRKRRIHFLICLSVLQFAFMWILVY